jgi:hypothetical protein
VSKGLYSVLLGDATIPNMTAVPAAVFANSDVRLRIWFNDDNHGWQKLAPDQRLAAVGYAMTADSARTVPDGAITSAKIVPGAVGNSQLAAGAVQSGNIANGAVGASQIAAGAVGASQIAAGAVGNSQLASGAVQSGNIANGAVGASQVAAGAIGSAQLAAGALARVQGVAGPTLTAAANTSYAVTGTEPAGFYLPTSANTGDLIRITGASAGWSAAQPDLWTPRDSTRAWRAVASSADGTKLVACAENGLIYTSTDSGATWTARESARKWISVASSADGTKLAACAYGDHIYTSTDSGIT